jgi:MarR family transcriptional regulator, organic hydroperoxide resistance regulator
MSTSDSLLQREIRQTKPFASRGAEALLGLLRTADFIRQKNSRIVAREKLSLEQYNVLRILRGAGTEGLPTLEIAKRMIQRTPAMTRLLDKLEQKGLVRRVRCTEDRRRVLCWITDTGLECLARLDAPLEDANKVLLRPLSEDDLKQLIGLLDRIRQGK